MEAAANQTATEYSRYGSTQDKQVYIYGGLERRPTTLTRSYGMQWSVGGWLLTPFLQKVGPARAEELRQRVADEIKTTFASGYTEEISLVQALQVETLQAYALQATGKKFLINPTIFMLASPRRRYWQVSKPRRYNKRCRLAYWASATVSGLRLLHAS